MANWSTLKAAVADIINTNGNQAITGQLLQNVLNNIITNVGENATFAGIATLATNPGAPDGPVFYLATTAGIYANFNGIEVLEGEAVILLWNNGTWSKKSSGFTTQKALNKVELHTNSYEFELGRLNATTGLPEASTNRVRSKSLIDVNTVSYIEVAEGYKAWAWFYDKDGNYISRINTEDIEKGSIPSYALHIGNYNIRIVVGLISDEDIDLVSAKNALIIHSVDKLCNDVTKLKVENTNVWVKYGDVQEELIKTGVLDFILDAYLDAEFKEGNRYMFSLINKTESISESYFALYRRNINDSTDYSAIKYFSNGEKLFNNIYKYTAGNSKVLVNWDLLKVNNVSVALGSGIEVNPRVFRKSTLNDVIALDEKINMLSRFVEENLITYEIISANLHNPSTDKEKTSLDDASGLSYVESTRTITDYIPVEAGVEYVCSAQMRKIWDFEDNKGLKGRLSMVENVKTFTPSGNYVRFLFTPQTQRVAFGKAEDDINQNYTAKYIFKGDELLNNSSAIIHKLFSQIQYLGSGNLLNPQAVEENIILDSLGGGLHENPMYSTSDFIAVDSDIEYRGNLTFRRIAMYDSLLGHIQTIDNVSSFVTNSKANYVRLSWDSQKVSSPYNVKFGKSTEDISGDFGEYPHDKYRRRIALKEDIREPKNGDYITLKSSDKILFLGSSSTESHYALRNKSWFMKLNDELDWLFTTYAFSGNSAGELTSKLLIDRPSPTADSLPPSMIKPSYVHVGQFGNMSDEGLNASTSEEFIESNRKLMLTAQAVFNAKLIVGTGYHDYEMYQLETALKALADEFNADFIPWGYYNNKIIRSVNNYRAYKGFYGAAHPGTRSNNFYFQEALNFFKKWQRPNQGIKMFKPRSGVEDYNYRDNKERARKFYSIQVGEQSLSDAGAAYYDRLEPTSNYSPFDKNQSEYNMLMQGKSVDFGSTLLVEFILPVSGASLSEIYVMTDSTDIIASLYNNIADSFENTQLVSIEGGVKIEVNSYKYYSFDKVKLLLTGGNVTLSNIYMIYEGGKKKQSIDKKELLYIAGEKLFGNNGFSDEWLNQWSSNGVTSYKQAEKYGSEFVDIPSYIDADKNNILELSYSETTSSKISKTFTEEELYGNRNPNAPLHLRVEVYARMWCKIYDPERFASWNGEYNPFTDQPILTTDSYDYGTMQIGIKGANGKTALIESNVGMFWSRIPFDIYLPPFSGSQTISVGRKVSDINSHLQMEIVDVVISVVN